MTERGEKEEVDDDSELRRTTPGETDGGDG